MRTCNKPSPSSSQKCALSEFETSGVALGLVEERLLIFNINHLYDTPGMTLASKTKAQWKLEKCEEGTGQVRDNACVSAVLASVGVKALGEVTHLFQIPAMVFQIETIYEKKERMGKISNSIKKLSVILSVSVASQRSTSHGQAFFFCLKKH